MLDYFYESEHQDGMKVYPAAEMSARFREDQYVLNEKSLVYSVAVLRDQHNEAGLPEGYSRSGMCSLEVIRQLKKSQVIKQYSTLELFMSSYFLKKHPSQVNDAGLFLRP